MNIFNQIKEINHKYKIGLIIYIFCFLFAPPIIENINFILVLAAYSFFYIIFKYRKNVCNLLSSTIIKKIIKLLTLYIIIYIISIYVNGIITQEWHVQNYIINFYSLFLAFPATFICSLYVIFRSDELNLDLYDVIKLFIWAGVIQATLVLLTLIFPSIKQFFLKIMYNSTKDSLLLTPWLQSRRFYGFAHSMLDLFGFGTGILATLPIFYGIKRNKFYIPLTILLLIIPFLNSRSGLVMFFIGVIILMLTNIKKIKIKYFIIGSIFIVIGIMGVYILIESFSPNTINWITNDLLSFTNRTTRGTADALLSKAFWTTPPLENILIGTGYNISAYSEYSVKNIVHSDVGYINELWKVGILGSCIIYYFLYYMLKSSSKKFSDKFDKYLYFFFGIAIIVFLIKASIFTYNPGTAIIYTLCLLPIYQNRKTEKGKHF